jgi:uncharacterized protein
MSQIQAPSPDEPDGKPPVRLQGMPDQGSPRALSDAATSPLRGSFEVRSTLTGRAKACGLVILYLAVCILLVAALLFGLAAAGLAPVLRSPHLTLTQDFLRECADAVAAVLAVVLLTVVTREPGSRFGFALPGASRDFPVGLATGLVFVAAPLGLIWVLGGCAFQGVALQPGRIPAYAAFYALWDLAVAVFEETLFRSFILVQLSRAVSFWPAAAVTALLFGAGHMVNLHEAPFGLLVVGLDGFVLAYSFRRSGALWFAIGLHAAYDYTEDFIFGVPDSGTVPQVALLHTTLHGPVWLTGGQVGPEASVLVLPAILVVAVIVRLILPRREV